MRIDKITSAYDNYNKLPVSKTKAASKIGKKDEVALSEVAKDFRSVSKALAEVPEVRQDKIDEIKARMQSGNYTVDAKAVADKILSNFNIKG